MDDPDGFVHHPKVVTESHEEACGERVAIEDAHGRHGELEETRQDHLEVFDRRLEVFPLLCPVRKVKASGKVPRACTDSHQNSWSLGCFDLVKHFDVAGNVGVIHDVVLPREHDVVEGGIVDVRNVFASCLRKDLG